MGMMSQLDAYLRYERGIGEHIDECQAGWGQCDVCGPVIKEWARGPEDA